MNGNEQMIVLGADLDYAMQFGCLSRNPLPWSERELGTALRNNMRQTALKEKREWIATYQQSVAYGGLLFTSDVYLPHFHESYTTGLMDVIGGAMTLTVVKNGTGEWEVSTSREN